MNLPMQVTFRQVEEQGLEEFVRQQVAKLERYCDDIVSCRVLVEMSGRRRHGNAYHVRIDLGVPGEEIVVEHEPSVHASLEDTEMARMAKSLETGRAHRNPRRAVLDAFSEMRRRLQEYRRRVRGDVKTHAEPFLSGVVDRLYPTDGYGFLKTSDEREIYFHRDSVLHDRFDRLRIGSSVHFVEEMGEKGPQASTVRLVHPRARAKAAPATALVAREQAPPPR
jgi:cold shock CspA family protein/ribosome-associated translation inhibitor RaiA